MAKSYQDLKVERDVLEGSKDTLQNDLDRSKSALAEAKRNVLDFIDQQIGARQQRWQALHLQLADERSRTYGLGQGQIQALKSPFQVILSTFSPHMAAQNVRQIRDLRQRMLQPTPQELWLLGEISRVEREIDWWRAERQHPREDARMGQLRRSISWLEQEIERRSLRIQQLDAQIQLLLKPPHCAQCGNPLKGGQCAFCP